MIIRLIRFFLWIGHSGVIEMIAEQFGFAMMPLCVLIVCGLISGTTSGTSGSMRYAEELSTMIVPAATAAFANFLVVALPAENKPISTPSKLCSVSSFTLIFLPRNFSDFPAERADANSRSSDSGKLRCSRQWISSTPTAPVAPTIGDDWIRELLLGGHDRFSTNEKAPSVSGEASRLLT